MTCGALIPLLWQSDHDTRTSQGWCRLVRTGLELIRLKKQLSSDWPDCISSLLTQLHSENPCI